MHWGCVFAGVEPATFWFFRLGVSFRLESGKRWRNKIDKIHKCFLFPSEIMMDTKNIVRSLWEPITTFQILLLLEFWFYLRSWCLPNSSKCPDNLCLFYNSIVFCLGMLLDAGGTLRACFQHFQRVPCCCSFSSPLFSSSPSLCRKGSDLIQTTNKNTTKTWWKHCKCDILTCRVPVANTTGCSVCYSLCQGASKSICSFVKQTGQPTLT